MTRQAMYICVKHNIEARSCNHCCSGNAMSIKQHVGACAFVAFSIQQAMRMHHITICGLPCSTFFHIS